MYRERKQTLEKRLMRDNDALAFIVSPVHIHYYTGFNSEAHERFFALIYDSEAQKSYLFLPELDYEKAKEIAQVDELVPVSDTENGYDIVKQTVNVKRETVAIEKSALTVHDLEQLEMTFEDPNIIGIDQFITTERLRKSEEEIMNVRKAIDITEKGLAHIVEFVKLGMTEIEIKMELEFYLHSLGAEQMAFDTLVLTGPNAALPHGTSGLNKVEQGHFLLFDFGVTVNGYHSDITRTFIVGEGSQRQKEIYAAVKKANEEAIAAVVVGKPLKNIDIAARKQIEAASYGEYFIHRTGHGLGLEVHEAPSIHSENDALLKEGMLFTIEPGIYLPLLGGVRIEDDIYVDESGKVNVLTSYPKELISIKG